MFSRLVLALELFGVVLICAGCWLILPALGLIVAGLGLIAVCEVRG